MIDRGEIRNKDYARQLNNFSGLRYGKITPTDIDGFIDFGDRLFVFMEGKHGGAELSYGQRLALERITDACSNPPVRFSVCFIVDHNVPSNEDVNFSECTVREIRWEREWIKPSDPTMSARQAIDIIKEYAEKHQRVRI